MWYMKDDMSGAGVVIGAMEAIARLNVPRRVIGVAACVENMPDGKAFRPGDILTGITGKTTEIISTDAEGRLILADTLGYVARFDPSAVVDLATLTGAVGVALGHQAAGSSPTTTRCSDASAGGRRPQRRTALALAALRRVHGGDQERHGRGQEQRRPHRRRRHQRQVSGALHRRLSRGRIWTSPAMSWSDSAANAFTPKGRHGLRRAAVG